MAIGITALPVLKDNYAYLLEADDGETVVIDPSEPGPVLEALKARGRRLSAVWNTHHHWDHVGGNLALKQATGCLVVGFEKDAGRIPAIDTPIPEGQPLRLGGETVTVLAVPGHTTGAIAYYLPQTGAVFTGDTLFLMGCGRLFEGTADQMWKSLQLLKALPPDTLVYCGHEYAESNARFALSVEPENGALRDRAERIRARRADGRPSVPGTMAEELATNPFLRAADAGEFAERRRRKDAF